MNPLLSALVEAGVITQADADRIERQLDPEAARVFAERLLAESFQRGLTAQQRRMLDVVDTTQGNPTPRQLERLWAQEDELLWLSVGDDMRSIAIDRAVTASIGAVDANTWMLVNEEVVNWVDTYYTNPSNDAFGSIPNLNVTSRTQFADAFQNWQLGDRTPGNYAQGLPQLINDLVPIFGLVRAEAIAVTEVSRVFAESERFSAAANPFIEYFQYLTAVDETVCPICVPANNTVTEKGNATFPDGRGFPPRHPRCRCSVTQLTGPALAALREEGLIRD